MITFPNAKINIGLWITSKRDDGYHNIHTIFYPAGLCDALEFAVPSPKLRSDNLTVSGISPGDPADNLVLKALQAVRAKYKIPFLDIHLHKAIPPGAGLGGGSSDASAFIKLLNDYFNLGMSTAEMMDIALTLGSDCPFFITGQPACAGGRGEILTPLKPLSGEYHLVIVAPALHVSTKEAYSLCRPVSRDNLLSQYYKCDIREWRKFITNDFEAVIFEKYPRLKMIRDSLYDAGALYSSMSGSGSALYGIFSQKPELPESLLAETIYSGLL